ncbi:hypothetical protein PR202_ga19345 [Eleusine coracana subsp. coracana]|uniref:Transcription factor MYC/MYB N-terminal domain-containing protein n=1 Tax=Eleusine coracana subsp. coracana TaxID=191504 RepID=A0AAV5CVQ2_ELECO|nr:hypothetical protein PR202_ga19345 [Eleusine coracana subsp. coracana]
MEAALGALCRGGGWSYAAVWRFHPHDPRLLTVGESYCEDEARTVLEKMLTQVHIVGEGVIGDAIVSGNYKWIFSDTWHVLNQTNPAANRDLFQTIAILPLQLQGMVQFGSFRKVPRNSDFLNQVRYIIDQMKGASKDHPLAHTQINLPTYGQQTILSSLGSANDILVRNKANPPQNEKLEENIKRIESLRSSIYSPINSQGSLNDITSQGSGNSTMHSHMLALPANVSICEIKEPDNVTDFLHRHVDATTPLQVSSNREHDSIIVSLMSAYKNLNSLHGAEKESSGQNVPEYESYRCSATSSPNSGLDELCYSGAGFSSSFTTVHRKAKKCHQNDSGNLLHNSTSFSSNPCFSKIQESSTARHPALVHEQLLVPDLREGPSHFSPEESFIQLTDATQTTCQISSEFLELPNKIPEEAIGRTSDDDMKDCDANNGLLESMIVDLSTNNFVQDWSGDSVLQAGNLPNLGGTHSVSVRELGDKHSLSTRDSGFPAISVIEQLLGGGAHKPGGHIPFVMKDDAFSSSNFSATSRYIFGRQLQSQHSKFKGSQSNNPEGMKFAKKRARAEYEDENLSANNLQMLCEERGFFLEIADNIRGFGLTILKGLMEARDGKIWARFLLEVEKRVMSYILHLQLHWPCCLNNTSVFFFFQANRDVTRMDIFLSLVQLLEQNSLVGSSDQVTKVMNNGVPSFADHQRSLLPVPVGIAEQLQ